MTASAGEGSGQRPPFIYYGGKQRAAAAIAELELRPVGRAVGNVRNNSPRAHRPHRGAVTTASRRIA